MTKELIFSDVLVINMPSRKDRLDEFMSMYDSTFGHEFNFHLIEGVELTPETIPYDDIWFGFKNPDNYKNPYIGEIGCALAHIKAWEKVVELGRDCLILEDDAVPLHNDTYDRIRKLSTDGLIARHWDFMYLGRQRIMNDKPIDNDICEPGMSWLLHAYVLRPSGARKLLETHYQNHLFSVDNYVPVMYNNGFDGIDEEFSSYEKMNAIAVTVDLFGQRYPYTAQTVDKRLAHTSIDGSPEIFWPGTDPKEHLYCHLYCASDMNKADILLDSLQRHQWGSSFNIFPIDETWIGGSMEGPGGAQKVLKLKSVLDLIEDPEAIVVFTDAYDVMVLQGSDMVVRDWLENFDWKHKVTFAAENILWPGNTNKQVLEQIPGYSHAGFGEYSEAYLNSGCFIGLVKNVREVVEYALEFINKPDDDDQAAYQMVYLQSELIELDDERILFQCLNDADQDSISFDGQWCSNNRTRKHPLILHGNGPSKGMLIECHKLATQSKLPNWVGFKTLLFGPKVRH